ncbi:MAG: hypothetical protein Q4G48_05850 [Bacteroidia bacterium]|nr:hypothetical protein [Bacteroidia bacterium]
MEKTNKKNTSACLSEKPEAIKKPETKKVHPRWFEFQKLIGTGKILDMRAVLK